MVCRSVGTFLGAQLLNDHIRIRPEDALSLTNPPVIDRDDNLFTKQVKSEFQKLLTPHAMYAQMNFQYVIAFIMAQNNTLIGAPGLVRHCVQNFFDNKKSLCQILEDNTLRQN